MSLLEYIIRCIRENKPDLLKFTQELATCETASKVELSMLTGMATEFESDLAKVEKELEKTESLIAQKQEQLDLVSDVMKFEDMEEKITDLSSQLSSLLKFQAIFMEFLGLA